MTDQLSLYNLALGHLQERRLASISENREPRRVLDDYWFQVVAYCLERKFWNFSYRTAVVRAATDYTPGFGYSYAFQIPADWVRTRRLSASPTLSPPLFQMAEESGFWYANVNPLYVQFNSNDPAFGMNLTGWPASYADYVALRLATQSCKRITGKSDLLEGPQGLLKQEEKAYKIAAANCAMNEPIGFAPMSGWARSRRGAYSPGRGGDDPSGGSLIG